MFYSLGFGSSDSTDGAAEQREIHRYQQPGVLDVV